MTIDELLRKHCPSHCRTISKGARCLTCGPWAIALEEAKREGYRVACKLIEKNPAAAGMILRSLLESLPPEQGTIELA